MTVEKKMMREPRMLKMRELLVFYSFHIILNCSIHWFVIKDTILLLCHYEHNISLVENRNTSGHVKIALKNLGKKILKPFSTCTNSRGVRYILSTIMS